MSFPVSVLKVRCQLVYCEIALYLVKHTIYYLLFLGSRMTEDWLREIDDKMIVGAVLLDFSADFDIIDHSLMLEKRMCYGFTHPVDKELLV